MSQVKLIDTSAWIEFFKGREPVASQVDAALADDSAAVCGMVELELVAGLKDNESYVLELLAAVRRINTVEEDYYAAGVTLQQLRQRGITVAATDGLIAHLAIKHDAVLIEKDKHFQHFSLPEAVD